MENHRYISCKLVLWVDRKEVDMLELSRSWTSLDFPNENRVCCSVEFKGDELSLASTLPGFFEIVNKESTRSSLLVRLWRTLCHTSRTVFSTDRPAPDKRSACLDTIRGLWQVHPLH